MMRNVHPGSDSRSFVDLVLSRKTAQSYKDLNQKGRRTWRRVFVYGQHLLNSFNPLPDMPILGSSISTANKEMMSKIQTNGDTII